MRAIVFDAPRRPLRIAERDIPAPGPGELLIRVRACGVCRTDLHLLDGELDIANPPRVLGHQIVGTVAVAGDARRAHADVREMTARHGSPCARPVASEHAGARPVASEPMEARIGERVGVPWLGWTCGECQLCRAGRENLCPRARFTGRDIDGGFADWTVADARYCLPVPTSYPDEQAAPLLCAGFIGYRALRMCGEARTLGFYGFGASAHILAQIARWEGREVLAFTRPGDTAAQRLARELGASWAGGSDERPPEPLDAAIVFAPHGPLVPAALAALAPGGTVVCAGIHMSDIPAFPYELLWHERTVRSVANLTRADGAELLRIAPQVPVRTHVGVYPLELAEAALSDLRAGRFTGAAVLVP